MAQNNDNNKMIPYNDGKRQLQKVPKFGVPDRLKKFLPPALFKKPEPEKQKDQTPSKKPEKHDYDFGEEGVSKAKNQENKPRDWKKYLPKNLLNWIIRNPAVILASSALLIGAAMFGSYSKNDKKSKDWLVTSIKQNKLDSTVNKSKVYDRVMEITSYNKKDTTIKETEYYAIVNDFRTNATLSQNANAKGVLGKELQEELVTIYETGISDKENGMGQGVTIRTFEKGYESNRPDWQLVTSGDVISSRETINAHSKTFKINMNDIKGSAPLLALPIDQQKFEEFKARGTIKGMEKLGF